MERLNALKPYAKAITAAAVAGLGALLLVVTGNETFSDVTLAEGILVALAILGSGGATYAIPNRPKS